MQELILLLILELLGGEWCTVYLLLCLIQILVSSRVLTHVLFDNQLNSIESLESLCLWFLQLLLSYIVCTYFSTSAEQN